MMIHKQQGMQAGDESLLSLSATQSHTRENAAQAMLQQ
jgi:hypothetical protein